MVMKPGGFLLYAAAQFPPCVVTWMSAASSKSRRQFCNRSTAVLLRALLARITMHWTGVYTFVSLRDSILRVLLWGGLNEVMESGVIFAIGVSSAGIILTLPRW